jgi:hypothetical protein
MTARLSLPHSTSVEYFIGQLTLSSSVSLLFKFNLKLTSQFLLRLKLGLVWSTELKKKKNSLKKEKEFSGRQLFFRMRVDSRLVGLLFFEECGVNMCPGLSAAWR